MKRTQVNLEKSWQNQLGLFQNQTFLFFTLSTTNAVLSYLPLDLPLKLVVFSTGILTPLFLSLLLILSTPPKTESFTDSPPKKPAIPTLLWLLPIFLGIFLRLYQLTSLSVWPLLDESYLSSSAMELSEKWNWKFFYSSNHYPPLTTWALAIFYKLFTPSLTSLWLFPALLSILSMILLGLTAKRILPPTTAFIFINLCSLSFWPIFTARFCNATNFFFFCQALAASCLCYWLINKPSPPTFRSLWIAGLGLGLGFYSYYPWVVVLFLGLILVWKKYPGGVRRIFPPLAAACALALIPLAWAQWRLSGSYVQSLWFWNDTWQNHLTRCVHYVSNIFWTHVENFSGYGAYWGGFLNPLLGAGFLLGILELFKKRHQFESKFIFLALGLCWLPSFLTNDLEMFRVLQGMPFVLVITALGVRAFLHRRPEKTRWKTSLLFLLLSTLLDTAHLFIGYGSVWSYSRNWTYKYLEAYRAFEVIKKHAEKNGPGYLLTELGPLSFDHTLRLAAYAFDLQHNRSLTRGPNTWVAVLTDPNLEPFLRKRFPDVQWLWLSEDLRRFEGGTLLGVIPLNPKTEEILGRWIAADSCFQSMNFQDSYQENPDPSGKKEESFKRLQVLIAQDPFIASCFFLKGIRQNQNGDPAYSIRLIEGNFKYGYPAGTYYFALGNQRLKQNRISDAKAAFEDALKTPGNRTWAAYQLFRLQDRK